MRRLHPFSDWTARDIGFLVALVVLTVATVVAFVILGQQQDRNHELAQTTCQDAKANRQIILTVITDFERLVPRSSPIHDQLATEAANVRSRAEELPC